MKKRLLKLALFSAMAATTATPAAVAMPAVVMAQDITGESVTGDYSIVDNKIEEISVNFDDVASAEKKIINVTEEKEGFILNIEWERQKFTDDNLSTTEWVDATDNGNVESFSKGQYRVNISIEPKEGYELSEDFKLYLNGESVDYDVNTGYTLERKVDYDKAAITGVDTFAMGDEIRLDLNGREPNPDQPIIIGDMQGDYVAYLYFPGVAAAHGGGVTEEWFTYDLYRFENNCLTIKEETSKYLFEKGFLKEGITDFFYAESQNTYGSKIKFIYPERYTIIEGADSTHVKGSSDTVEMVSDAPYNRFVSVKVDGDIVNPFDYVLDEGSTGVTFGRTFLNTLDPGTHEVRINSILGYAKTSLNIILDGWQTIEGETYYYRDGEPLKGWQTIDGKRYWLDKEEGYMHTDDWYTTEYGNLYYVGEDGVMVTGWQTIGDDRYWFDVSGRMNRSKWYTTEYGNKYYVGEDGVMVKGWQTIDEKRYWFDSEVGRMQKNKWYMTEYGNMYYVGADGVMYTGWKTIDGERYWFAKNGRMHKNEWYTTEYGNKYYVLDDGKSARNGSWVLEMEDGSVKDCTFDKDGRLISTDIVDNDLHI